MFVEKEDFKLLMRDTTLEKILTDDVDGAMFALQADTAISQATEYLSGLYDVEAIFSATGPDRHAYLLKVILYIIRYQIMDLVPGLTLARNNEPTKVERDYQNGLDWLKALSRGDIESTLPKRVINNPDGSTGTKSSFRAGSQTPRDLNF